MRYRDLVLSRRPAGYWRFGDAAGTEFADASGYAQTGTWTTAPLLGKPGLLGGENGKGVDPNIGGKGTVPHHARLVPTTAVAVEVWSIPTLVDANFRCVCEKSNGSNATVDYLFGMDAGTKWTLDTRALSTLAASPDNTVAGKLYHVVGIDNGTRATLIVNGVVKADVAVTGAFQSSTQVLTVGHRNGGSAVWGGVIDELAVYIDGNVPSLAAFREHYRVGRGEIASGLRRRLGG